MALLEISGETLTDLALPSTSTPPEAEYARFRRAADGLFAGSRQVRQRRRVPDQGGALRRQAALAAPRRPGSLPPLHRTRQVSNRRRSLSIFPARRTTRGLRQDDARRGSRLLAAALRPARASAPGTCVAARLPRLVRRHPQGRMVLAASFRLWQANRKVYLYPENYLEPDLRDDKTPLFKTLEDTLLQQKIDEQNVRDGYADTWQASRRSPDSASPPRAARLTNRIRIPHRTFCICSA